MQKSIVVLLLMFVLILTTACQNNDSGGFDIETARIGVMTGTTGEDAAIETYPNANISGFGNISDALAALQAGRIDAVVTPDVVAINAVRENPYFERLDELLNYEYVCAGVKKGNDELLAEVNRIIAALWADGTFDDKKHRWIDSYPAVPAQVPRVSEGEVLRVGTAGISMPFIYVDGDRNIVGYAPELALRIGYELGRPVEFLHMDFTALIPALESGLIDIVVDMMAATDERRQAINFSEPYYVSGHNLLLLRTDAPQTAESFWQSLKTGFERNLIQEDRWKLVLEGLQVSIIITVFAFALSTVLGFGICGLRMSKNPILKAVGSIYVTVLRGTPIVVLLMIMFYIIFARSVLSGTVIAIIAFGANGAAFIGEIIRSAISTIDKGQVEAARSMGFSKTGAFFNVTFPQAVRVAFPVYMSEFVSLFKMTSVVGYIAIIDLTKAGDIIRSRTYDAFFPLIMVALVYLIAASLMIWLLNFINRKTNKRLRRSK